VTIVPFGPASAAEGTYTVQAGENSADLNVTAASLAENATLKDGAGNDAGLGLPAGNNLKDNKNLVVDTVAPALESISSTTVDGVYGIGTVIPITLSFTEPVTLSGGDLTLTLDSGGTATITAFGPATTAEGTYTVQAGENSADLDVTAVALSGGTLRDGAGNDAGLGLPAGNLLKDLKDIEVDGMVPLITGVTTSTVAGTYGEGAAIDVTITFSEPVTLAGDQLQVTLNTGTVLTAAPFAAQGTLSLTYTVAKGDGASPLNVTSVTLQGAATLRDRAANDADLTLPAGNNLGDNAVITVNTTPAPASPPSGCSCHLPGGRSGTGGSLPFTALLLIPLVLLLCRRR